MIAVSIDPVWAFCRYKIRGLFTGLRHVSYLSLHEQIFFMKNFSPPYYAVIFTSVRSGEGDDDYEEMSVQMSALAQQQPGYLGHESARSETGITVSYWESPEAIRKWRANAEHLIAQKKGRSEWYSSYKVRICRVEREYEFEK